MRIIQLVLLFCFLPSLTWADEIKAAWLQPYAITKSSLASTLKSVEALGLNTIYLRMHSIDEGNGVGNQSDFISALDALDNNGIKVHAWITNGQRSNDNPWNVDNGNWSNLADSNEKSKQQSWVLAILSMYPKLAGIHLDYIRYPDINNRPKDPSHKENITDLVCAINSSVKSKGEYFLSAAVFAAGSDLRFPGFARVEQDPVEWLRSECIDWVVPMQYFVTSLAMMTAEINAWQHFMPEGISQVHFGMAHYPQERNGSGGEVPENLAYILPFVRSAGFGGVSVFTIGNSEIKESEDRLIKVLGPVLRDDLLATGVIKTVSSDNDCIVASWSGIDELEFVTKQVAQIILPCDGILRIFSYEANGWWGSEVSQSGDEWTGTSWIGGECTYFYDPSDGSNRYMFGYTPLGSSIEQVVDVLKIPPKSCS